MTSPITPALIEPNEANNEEKSTIALRFFAGQSYIIQGNSHQYNDRRNTGIERLLFDQCDTEYQRQYDIDRREDGIAKCLICPLCIRLAASQDKNTQDRQGIEQNRHKRDHYQQIVILPADA